MPSNSVSLTPNHNSFQNNSPHNPPLPPPPPLQSTTTKQSQHQLQPLQHLQQNQVSQASPNLSYSYAPLILSLTNSAANSVPNTSNGPPPSGFEINPNNSLTTPSTGFEKETNEDSNNKLTLNNKEIDVHGNKDNSNSNNNMNNNTNNKSTVSESKGYSSTLTQSGQFSLDEIINILSVCTPLTPEDYSEHILKICSLLYDDELSINQFIILDKKFDSLMSLLPHFINYEDPIHSKLYLLIEKCFDIFIKISTNHKNVELATKTIRFLTNVIMSLNYWEIYNLLSWKPSIYHFLNIIHFDLNDCYSRFLKDYSKFNYKQSNDIIARVSKAKLKAKLKAKRKRSAIKAGLLTNSISDIDDDDDDLSSDDKSSSETPNSFFPMGVSSEDHDQFVFEQISNLTPKEKKKIRVDAKLAAHRIIKKTQTAKPLNKSSNYDPDVVHECQLPSADEPDKLCLRRFSRKYELIRHQETVHLKKKKLFKCFVCVKQNPSVGPRIFTRHDTLAKHIRVNHKISGKEAKAEVAYSKKHAEVVEEGDITVHVGRRKTKVDFELRAHMEKKKLAKELPDGEIITEDIIDSAPEDIIDSAEETME